jgi:uncharacterized protein DUF6602
MNTTSSLNKPKLLKDWFDQLEITLSQEIDLAGLMGHSLLTGISREQFLTRAIRQVLPPMAHIGSGIVVDGKNGSSKQVDVVVYDSRFPVLRSALGCELYLIEGVIATIEVKSKLNKQKLLESLDNCHSVMILNTYACKQDLDLSYNKLKSKKKKSHNDAIAEIKRSGKPYTYVFSFDGYRRGPNQLCKNVDEWFTSKDRPSIGQYPLLPSVIVAGNVVGVSRDCLINPKLPEYRKPDHDKKMKIMFCKTNHQFGIFMSHLVVAATSRLGLTNIESGIKYSIKHYLPLKEYFDELPLDRDTPYII